MNISEMNDRLESIPLEGGQKRGLLQVVDMKINNDMKEVIAEIRQLEKVIEGKIQVLEGKIQITQDKIQMVHDKLSNEIKIVYWVVAIAMSVILFAVARK
jgi:hypothetical protein